MKWLLLIFIANTICAQTKTDSLLIGTKKFGVQFIYDGYGKLKISKQGKIYSIKGEQYSKLKDEYCIIEGTLEALTPASLKFNGQIKLLTKDCCGEVIKNGNFTFVSSGKRKFWRLQERSELCDEYKCCYYLDIFK